MANIDYQKFPLIDIMKPKEPVRYSIDRLEEKAWTQYCQLRASFPLDSCNSIVKVMLDDNAMYPRRTKLFQLIAMKSAAEREKAAAYMRNELNKDTSLGTREAYDLLIKRNKIEAYLVPFKDTMVDSPHEYDNTTQRRAWDRYSQLRKSFPRKAVQDIIKIMITADH